MNEALPQAKILDCTIRDGGYYNEWRFSSEFVRRYLGLLPYLGINYSEIGFRSNSSTTIGGVHLHTPESYIEALEKHENLHLGVMINASEFLENPSQSIHRRFSKKSDSRLDFVRIAVNSSEFETAKILHSTLKELGYQVFINIMQMHAIKVTQTEPLIRNLVLGEDVVYFADSFGK